MPAIPLHWHFVAAAPPQHQDRLPSIAKGIWEHQRFGYAHVELYNPALSGAYYLVKTAHNPDFDYVISNLERLCSTGQQDLYELQQEQAYVPDHGRHLTSGETLALRVH
jgi:hypothetical protein